MRTLRRFTPTRMVVVLACSALVASACGSSEPPQSQTTVDDFAAALSSQNIGAAAELTSDPAAATATLTQMYDGLGGDGSITATPSFTVGQVDEEQNTFSLAVSWSFDKPDEEQTDSSTTATPTTSAASTTTAGDGVKRVWAYNTTGSLADLGQGLKVTWTPSSVVPGLTADTTVRYTPTAAESAPRVLDNAGATLMSQQTVTLVNLDSTADAGAVAALVSPFAPTVTAESLRTQLTAAAGSTVTAVSLRDEDLAPISSLLTALPGVTLAPQTRLLTDNRSLSSPVLNDITSVWQGEIDDSAGWAVQLVAADGSVASRLAGVDASVGADVPTTLDTLLQLKAENALSSLPQQAAIVAIRPSTGAVLAVAQNDAADAQGPVALTGLYPPGSTFKTVTTSAALQAGGVTPDTVLGCPGTENIEGRQIPNDDNFDLGEVPLHTAFAKSCNTTMARLAGGLPDDALQNAALQFGLGLDYTTPGLTTVTGNVPPATNSAERVESAIGQGAVTASPFGMALVAASIAHGSTPAPMMIQGEQGTPDRTVTPVSSEVTDQLKTMMRETVTAGTATSLQDIPNLIGKTGTAEVADQPAHGWFVGIQGDLAFAVFVAGGDSSAPALAAAGSFLR